MTNEQIYEVLNGLFHDIFDDDGIVLSPGTTARDIEGWDSLSNIQVIVAVETSFSIRLTAAQIASLANVSELVEVIRSKTSRHSEAIDRE